MEDEDEREFRSLEEVYCQEQLETLAELAKLKRKAKTASEIQELEAFEKAVKANKPSPKAVKIYKDLELQQSVRSYDSQITANFHTLKPGQSHYKSHKTE